MARGIIYVMTTAVPGLVKIGKTGTDNFRDRMYQLERNGYFNVTALKREFAIEVDDYDEKEAMLDDIFSRSRVPNSELFALDVDLVVQLLSSFEGKQVYPVAETKEQVFEHATEDRRANPGSGDVPDGTYRMSRKIKKTGRVLNASMDVVGGSYVIRAGTRVSEIEGAGLSSGIKQQRDAFVGPDGVVTEDVTFRSPSGAGSFVLGASCDGWVTWRNGSGQAIDVYRTSED
ncbi:MAG: DUF4357 domain-containing protein [Atopobiaceae bacterium]|nr:DUF4357 domain-containing protein [Atopobiaceae bacterium]